MKPPDLWQTAGFNAAQWEKYKCDPRPDLIEDHHLWRALLLETGAKNPDPSEPYYTLHMIRCKGARIDYEDKSWIIQPRIGSTTGWDTWDEWEEDRKRYLIPYVREIKQAMEAMRQ